MAKKDKSRVTADPVSYQIPDPAGGVQMETFIPWMLVKRGVKRQVITPLDAPEVFREEADIKKRVELAEQDRPLVKALGLAYLWQHLLDEGKAATIADIAAAEGLDKAYVSHICRLANLAPNITESCLRGGQAGLTLDRLVRRGVPREWDQQEEVLRRI